MSIARADASRLPLADRSVDLVLGSPPYGAARKYFEDGKDLLISRDAEAWVDWMLGVTSEALRVSKGLVIWICAGTTIARNYQPFCEGLLWEWWKRGGESHCLRPAYWNRVGIPGSGGDQWLRSDIEYALAFKRPGKVPWSNNIAMGKPPKYQPGGTMSYRDAQGQRKHTKRRADGEMEDQTYTPPSIANPGNLIKVDVGGGRLGSSYAHENEAPYPEGLAEFFIRSWCPPGGTVLDPFSGSGTTVDVARQHDRVGIGFDFRQSQCLLGQRRLKTMGRKPREVPVVKGQLSFLEVGL